VISWAEALVQTRKVFDATRLDTMFDEYEGSGQKRGHPLCAIKNQMRPTDCFYWGSKTAFSFQQGLINIVKGVRQIP
jgi:hypothetical protein